MKTKKIICIMVIVCIATLCAAVFAGCSALAMPEGFKHDGATLLWNAVEGADGYMVRVNDSNEFFVKEAYVSVNNENLKDGLINNEFNTLWVKAVTLKENGDVAKSTDYAQFGFDFAAIAETEWKITFNFNYTGGPKAQSVMVTKGEKFNKPADPQRYGHKFDGWYKEQQCVNTAEFSADGKNNFDVIANTTLYAKWVKDTTVATAPIYFYTEAAQKLAVKPYKGETALFDGKSISMSAVAGKANWYKADIDASATSVIFVNGDEETDSIALDKSKPYLKDGVWTEQMPQEPVVEINHEVLITVGENEPQQLTENPTFKGEFIIGLNLESDDTVVITMDGQKINNYDTRCNFTGKAMAQGHYEFYVTSDRIWVNTPESADGAAYLVVNDHDEKPYKGKANYSPMDSIRVEVEYEIAIRLREGDTVKIMQGDTEITEYENATVFNGTANLDGKYTFYVKMYKNGDRKVYVSAPKLASTDLTEEPTTVYFHNVAGWSTVYLYCWSGVTNGDSNAGWPGKKMQKVEGTDDWYVLEIDAGYSMIIFSDNGSPQTDDLPLIVENGVTYYTPFGVTEERPNLEPEEPEEPEQPEEPEVPEQPELPDDNSDTEQTQGV